MKFAKQLQHLLRIEFAKEQVKGRLSGQQWGKRLSPDEQAKEAKKLLTAGKTQFQDFLYGVGVNGLPRAEQEKKVWQAIQKAKALKKVKKAASPQLGQQTQLPSGQPSTATSTGSTQMSLIPQLAPAGQQGIPVTPPPP